MRLDPARQGWMAAANLEDSDAIVKLGHTNLRPDNLGEAILWFTRSTDAGHADAEALLARLQRR